MAFEDAYEENEYVESLWTRFEETRLQPMEEELERAQDALCKIIRAREHHAEHGKYPLPPEGPDPSSQSFDDWAADVANQGLQGE